MFLQIKQQLCCSPPCFQNYFKLLQVYNACTTQNTVAFEGEEVKRFHFSQLYLVLNPALEKYCFHRIGALDSIKTPSESCLGLCATALTATSPGLLCSREKWKHAVGGSSPARVSAGQDFKTSTHRTQRTRWVQHNTLNNRGTDSHFRICFRKFEKQMLGTAAVAISISPWLLWIPNTLVWFSHIIQEVGGKKSERNRCLKLQGQYIQYDQVAFVQLGGGIKCLMTRFTKLAQIVDIFQEEKLWMGCVNKTVPNPYACL